MKIKFATTAAGPQGSFIAGSVHDVSADFGASLVAGGYAVSLELEIQEAVAPEYETATVPRAKKGAKP